MKKIYITVICLFAASIIIFISSFIYLDKNNRKTYYYVINSSGRDIGTIRVDKFVTDDKLIYKTAVLMPYDEIITESKTKMAYDRKYNLESYAAERTANGAIETTTVEKKDSGVSFVSRLNARFAFLENIPVRKETFIFEEDSPATYMPIIENYDFLRGKSQGFSAISCFSDWELPPMKRFVTLTSIRNEYLKIGRKKIKAENLLLKIKDYPQGSIWVAKIDKSLIKIEIPAIALKITRIFSLMELTPKNYIPQGEGYLSRDVAFKNDGVNLSGTLTIPLGEGKYPAVLLAGPDGPEERSLRGVFTDLAGNLSKNGFAVLRFDKRGIGSSDGNFASLSEGEETDDLAKALDFLAAQKEVDPQNLFILGHSQGASRALKLASEKNYIKGLVLMAPEIYSRYGAQENFENYDKIFFDKKWGQDYSKSVKKSLEDIRDKASRSKGSWALIQWKRCFVKRVKEEADRRPSLFISNVKAPVLVLQGRLDTPSSMESSSLLDKMLENSANIDHALTYYGYLGRYFGKAVNDGMQRIHYEVDKDVLYNIVSWLSLHLH